MLEALLTFPFPIVSSDVTATTNLVLVNHQTLQTHRPAGVDLVRTYTDFCAKAVAHAVCHPRRCVPEDAGRIYASHELFGRGG